MNKKYIGFSLLLTLSMGIELVWADGNPQTATPASQDFVIISSNSVKPERVKDFYEIFLPYSELTRKEDGNLAYLIHASSDDPSPDHPTRFTVYEHWKSIADRKKHLAADYTVKFFAQAGSLLEHPPVRRTFVEQATPFLDAAPTPGSATLPDHSQPKVPWRHIQLQSTAGTRIQFDYSADQASSGRFGSFLMAQPWLQVSSDRLTGKEHVQAVIVSNNTPWTQPPVTIDLTYDMDHHRFTGQAPKYMVVQTDPKVLPPHPDKNQIVTLSLAVVIDENREKDPISGDSTFQLNLTERPGTSDSANQ